MNPTYLLDWLALLTRWTHLIVGIAWIGASFYFVWLDNHLDAPTDAALKDKGVAGELWAVHGGGFYNPQKYRLGPPQMPGTLHWFYWEAYSTWLSGFAMLVLVYFLNPELNLLDPARAAPAGYGGVAVALGFIVGGWLVYDGLCRSPLAKAGWMFGAVLALLLAQAAVALCWLFSGRGAFILFGAMLGTMMVANVAMVIIPGQRRMVAAIAKGEIPNPVDAQRGKQRSVHNTYFTLPVLFAMLSNHYSFTYGSAYNWVFLITIMFAGAAIPSPVLVYDDDHYYMAGALAEQLRKRGLEVHLATPAANIVAEGDDYTFGATTPAVRYGAYTQIMRKDGILRFVEEGGLLAEFFLKHAPL